ncbi:MAG TPA: hypothetical protein VGC34_05185 [Steroidobacteraceae bacterium]
MAVWLDPSIITHSSDLRIDVSTTFGPNYGDSLSWTAAEAPGLGEQTAKVVFEVNVAKFERMTLDLLMAAPPAH